jgi:hypothetical protein
MIRLRSETRNLYGCGVGCPETDKKRKKASGFRLLGKLRRESRKPKAGRFLTHILDVGGDPPLIAEDVGYGAHAVSVRLFRGLFH